MISDWPSSRSYDAAYPQQSVREEGVNEVYESEKRFPDEN